MRHSQKYSWGAYVAALAAVAILACESGDDQSIVINGLPNDPHLATIEQPGYTVHLFGTKDGEGAAIHVASLVLGDHSAGRTLTAHFDALGRPTIVSDTGGNVASLTYTDTVVAVHFTGAGGTSSAETIPLSSLEGFPGGPAPASQESAEAAKADQGERPITVVARVRLMANGNELEVVKNIGVVGQVSGKSLAYPAAYDEAKGGHVFQFVHRTQEIDQGKAECEKLLGKAGEVYTHAGTVLAVLALGCALSTAGTGTPFCIWLLSWKGALIGAAIAGGSSGATIAAKDCVDLVIPADKPQVSVLVVTSHAKLGAGNGQGAFDISQLSDPVNQTGRLDITIDYEASGIIDVTPDPPAPAGNESYRLVFTLGTPGASVKWSISGDDGYGQEGLATPEPGSTKAISDSIPGGASGVTETIAAQAVTGETQQSVGGPLSAVFVFK